MLLSRFSCKFPGGDGFKAASTALDLSIMTRSCHVQAQKAVLTKIENETFVRREQ
jgi:hypothetical protein